MQNRRLTAAYEREKSVTAELNTKLQAMIRSAQTPPEPKSAKPVGDDKALRDKLSLITRKLEDERLNAQKLKAEIANLNKLLVRETGSEVALLKVQAYDKGERWVEGETRTNHPTQAETKRNEAEV
jgi:hypothetical protein